MSKSAPLRQRADEGAGEGGLARPEIALQQHRHAGAREQRELGGEALEG